MPLATPVHCGRVVWTGENPGILLKETPDGPWSAIALFFRIAWSPAGRGSVLMLYEDPNDARSLPTVANVLLSDNPALAEFLRTSFIAKLPTFADAPAFAALQHVSITQAHAVGDPRTCYGEVVKAPELEVELTWDELGKPTALELPVELTGGKEHEAYNVLVECRKPQIRVNGKVLKGKPVAREQAGIKTTSAFLYFSESWIDPAGCE